MTNQLLEDLLARLDQPDIVWKADRDEARPYYRTQFDDYTIHLIPGTIYYLVVTEDSNHVTDFSGEKVNALYENVNRNLKSPVQGRNQERLDRLAETLKNWKPKTA